MNHTAFSYESLSERVLKIGPHLPKLLSNIKWLTFLGTQCIFWDSVFMMFIAMLKYVDLYSA